MHSPQLFLAGLVIVMSGLLTACDSTDSTEPDKEALQQAFVQHSGSYEDLLKMFREEIVESNVSFVSAASPSRTTCGLRPQRHECTLRVERWKDYQRRLNQLGILWVEHNKPADRFYFVTYYKPFLMNARLLGVVFSEEQAPQFSTYHPKQEWRPIQGGWHTFLMIDD